MAVAIGIAVGGLLALACGVELWRGAAEAGAELSGHIEPLPIAVAARDLAAGATVREEDLDFRAIPTQLISGSRVLWDWRSMAIGQPLLAPVRRDEPLRWSLFDPGHEAPSLQLGAGMVGVNVDSAQLKDLVPGERVRLRRRGKYTAAETVLARSVRVVAVDGTSGPIPGEDERMDAVWAAMLELAPAVAPLVLAADAHGELLLERVPVAEASVD